MKKFLPIIVLRCISICIHTIIPQKKKKRFTYIRMIQEYLNSVDKFIIIGDRVLIKPRDMESHTKSGLVLPATVKEKEEIHTGYIDKTGRGYTITSMNII